jgi:hypothetical protein
VHSTTIVESYKDIARFKEGKHHMYIQAKKDLDQQWLSMHYGVIEQEISEIVNGWDVD